LFFFLTASVYLQAFFMPGQFPHASNTGVPATDLQFAAMVRIDQVGGMTKPAKCVRKRLCVKYIQTIFPSG
jgi:hypothetical protein